MGFQYEPLASNSIRLLKPLRKTSTDLSFEVVHMCLSSNPQYAALSYTWGAPGNTDYVFLGGHPFPIRKNLYDALRQIQESKWVESYLWVDAICINQGTDQGALRERSVQITIMKQIYEQAEKVLVWLGKPENKNNNQLAFDKMKYFWKTYLKRTLKAYPYRPWWWPNKPRTNGDNVANSYLTLTPAKDKALFDVPGSSTYNAWLGIISLWKNAWWTRTWVFQEATIPENYKVLMLRGMTTLSRSTKVRFLCGDQKTTWNALFATYLMATNILSTPGLDAEFLRGATITVEKLMHYREQRIQQAEHPFLSILQMFRHAECTDPRDKVYAPLCVASLDVRRYIRPDYGNKTALDVYTEVVQYCLTQPEHELDFLGFSKYEKKAQVANTPRGGTSPWPSWVPDFSSSLDLVPVPKVLHVQEKLDGRRVTAYDKRGLPNVNGPTIAAYRPLGDAPSRSFIENNKLHVSGVLVDVLKDIIHNKGPDMEATRAIAREKGSRWAFESSYKYPTGGTWADAINRTIVLEVVYDYMGRPSERGGRHDSAFLKKPRSELSLTEYRYQMNMNRARTKALTSRNLGFGQKRYSLTIPDTAEIGDTIWALSGGQALYILRKVNPSRGQYLFIGECYAHGLMDGEIVRMLRAGEANMEEVALI